LIWSIETALTTLVCVVDVLNWPGYSKSEVLALQQLYVPYLLLGKSSGVHCAVTSTDDAISPAHGYQHVSADKEECFDEVEDSMI
jgi:hypothetical protein